jgi:flagellar assembly protein FliH
MANSFWQAKTAENHLSNLLKKNMESVIAAFGFPLIQKDYNGSETMAPAHAEEEQDPGPQVNSEELHRRKLLELERRTQQIERDAYSQGFAQGEKDGFDYGQKSVQVVKSQLERIAQNMEALPAKIFQDYRDWLIQTSIRIARQLVKREIRTSPEIVADTVSALIEEAEDHGALTVYLNPNDMEIVEKRADLTLGANGKHIVLKADRDLERGGCRIESSVQLLDASIATLFENLEKKLLGATSLQNATDETGGELLGAG